MKPLRWIAVISLLAVFIAPPTRRAASEQSRLVLGLTPPQAYLPPPHVNFPVPTGLREKQLAAYRSIAGEHPDDIGIQMASAVAPVPYSMGEYSKGRVAALRPLLAPYPKSPALYANLLRYAAFALDDGSKEYPTSSINRHWEIEEINVAQPLPRVSPKEFDAWAAEGERLDPDNAWFPATRTIGLFMSGRKADAIAAIERAGAKSRWEDYWSDLRRGADSLSLLAYGRTDPFLFREYFDRPAVSKVMTDWRFDAIPEAEKAERAGNTAGGLRIRRSIWHVARLCRVHGSSWAEANVAWIISGFAATSLTEQATVDRNLPTEARYHSYKLSAVSHLRRMGYPADAALLKREIAEGEAVRDLLHINAKRLDAASSPLKARITWAGSAALLSAAIWCTVLAGLWALSSAGARRGWRVVFVAAACCLALAWQAWHFLGLLVLYSPPDVPMWLASAVVAVACAFAAPLLLVILFGLTALVRRKPLLKTSSAWLRASLVPAACVLTLLFVGVSVWGVKPQREWSEYRAAALTSEGRYYAHLVGKTWPE